MMNAGSWARPGGHHLIMIPPWYSNQRVSAVQVKEKISPQGFRGSGESKHSKSSNSSEFEVWRKWPEIPKNANRNQVWKIERVSPRLRIQLHRQGFISEQGNSWSGSNTAVVSTVAEDRETRSGRCNNLLRIKRGREGTGWRASRRWKWQTTGNDLMRLGVGTQKEKAQGRLGF